MKRISILLCIIFIVLLTSCSMTSTRSMRNPLKTSTPVNQEVEEGQELVMVLRPLDENRVEFVGTDTDCFHNAETCEFTTIVQLPKDMPQVQKIYWLEDGIHALFWDSDSGRIYEFDRLTGKFQLYKSDIWKTQSDFFFSPDGKYFLYDLQKDELENEIVLQDLASGDSRSLNIDLAGMKRIAQWLNNNQFLFWTEIYSGQKGYLEDIQVFTYDIHLQKLQPVDLGVDWSAASPPYYAPDSHNFVISTKDSIMFYDKENNKIKSVDMSPEKYLWSPDSTLLAVYTQENEIYLLNQNNDDEKYMMTIPKNSVLSDWAWIPGTGKLILILCNNENFRTSLLEYDLSANTLTTMSWPILEKVNIISLSFRPITK